MLTSDSFVNDRLTNYQLGHLYDFTTSQGTLKKICITSDNARAGLKAIHSAPMARVHNIVAITRTEATFALLKPKICTIK